MKRLCIHIALLCALLAALPAWSQSDRPDVPADSLVVAYLRAQGVPLTSANRVTLLKSGREKFDDLFATIRSARHHIHLEYFNFRNDSIANALFDLLALKAQEGVEIRALFDSFGNWSNSRPLKKKHLRLIRARGIEIHHFDPLRFPYLNHLWHRDHRKIVVVDGRVAYTGGMNVADYYIDGLPEIGAWRDTHLRLEGEGVAFLQQIFLDIWNKSTHQHVGGAAYFPPVSPADSLGPCTVAVVDRAPRRCPKLLRHTYMQSIRSARHTIRIVNPYFLPPRAMRRALKEALKRGVEVELMFSSKSDIGFTPDGSMAVAHRLMKRGASVYLYEGGFHHSKIMMVDDRFSTVGTANLDSRSLRYDYEVNTFLFDIGLTDELNRVFEHDKEQSHLLTPAVWRRRSAWRKFVGWCASVLTPFL